VEATGTIQHAEIATYRRVQPSLTGQTRYDANISYTYAVDGERFRSSGVFLGAYSHVGSGERVATAAADYADGESVTVHYLSGDPDRSYLLPRYSFVPGYALVVFGLLLGGEYLTPGTWLTGWVAGVLASAATGRRTDRDDEPHSYGWEADAVAESDEGDDTAALATGLSAAGVWALVALACLGAVGHYLSVSVAPYSGLATAAVVLGVGFPVAWMATTRPWVG
jgi:hypothetical protein